MDVPYISSGAISRTHYALVRKVESASSSQLTNQYLLTEINSIRKQLGRPGGTLKQCKEYLVVLLYCSMTVSSGFLPHGTFDFALSHAVSLAEAGQRVDDKRIGYFFCAEIMHPDHELQLMLVNTLRKDLESNSIPRVCLALDNLIISSNEAVIPAVQSRLRDLLSHNSSHVRRRALLAFRSISRHDTELLTRIAGKIVRRLKDPDIMVASAALVVSADFPSIDQEVRVTVNELFQKVISNTVRWRTWLLRILHALLALGFSEKNFPALLDLAHSASQSHDTAILRGTFLLLSKVPLQMLISSAKSRHGSPVQCIRHLVLSRNVNDQYLFLSCLECVDPVTWAGISPDFPAILEGWEVERVMQLLESSDSLIRRTTLRILNRIDPNIVASYYAQSLQTVPSELTLKEKNDHAIRLLVVLEAHCGQDGERYARELKSLLGILEMVPPTDHPVIEAAIEQVLVHVRNSDVSFRIGCTTTLLVYLTELATSVGQTLMVVIQALAAEYSGQLSIPPPDILTGLSSRLSLSIPTLQDACLLTMLRIAADCDEIPTEVTKAVTNLKQTSGRHIQQRCDQFALFTNDRQALAEIVHTARSSSLPDFLEALHGQTQRSTCSTTTAPQSPRLPPQTPVGASKLRYEAYELPPSTPRLRARRPSNSVSSSRSEVSDTRHEPHRSSSRISETSSDFLSRTITAGQLALAVGTGQLEMTVSETHARLGVLSPEQMSNVEDLSGRADLIAFDSPFVIDPQGTRDSAQEPDFKSLWTSLEDSSGARGWCNASLDSVVERLQRVEHYHLKVIPIKVQPYIGDLKMILSSESNDQSGEIIAKSALLRLRDSEEDGCLWRLRSGDAQLRVSVKRVMTDDGWNEAE